MKVDLQTAMSIAHASIVKAEELGSRVSVAICNTEGRLITFLKMDGSDVMSGHEAMRRAIAAAGSEEPSEIQHLNERDRASRTSTVENEGIGCSHRSGGLPLKWATECFGAVGVCGAHPEREVECARAGVDVFRTAASKDIEPGRA